VRAWVYIVCEQINNKLYHIDRTVQRNKNRHRVQQKPIFLRISTEADLISFENVEESYKEVVNWSKNNIQKCVTYKIFNYVKKYVKY